MSASVEIPAVRITEHDVLSTGARIRVRVYHPAHPGEVGLVWIHGGAFFMNDIDVPEVDWVARNLANAGVTVVTPDYRLADENVHFPSLTDDCAATWRWATRGDAPLESAPTTWHIGGGSAGGNLAASVAMQIRDHSIDAITPASTLLVYPVLHSSLPDASPELRAKLADLPADEVYAPEDVERINLNYVGSKELLQHPYAFPGHGDLVGMPPALIINSEYDPLRASGEGYGSQLAEAGVDITMFREIDAHHGHLNFPEQPAAQHTVERLQAWLVRPLPAADYTSASL